MLHDVYDRVDDHADVHGHSNYSDGSGHSDYVRDHGCVARYNDDDGIHGDDPAGVAGNHGDGLDGCEHDAYYGHDGCEHDAYDGLDDCEHDAYYGHDVCGHGGHPVGDAAGLGGVNSASYFYNKYDRHRDGADRRIRIAAIDTI